MKKKSDRNKDEDINITSNKKIDKNKDNINEKVKVDDFDENIREVIVERKTGFSTAEVLVIMVISIIFGCVIGGIIVYTKKEVSYTKIPSNLTEIIDTYNNIVDNYYDTVDKEKLTNSAIEGMVSVLDDPYSTYMDKNEASEFNEEVDGYYSGIGATVSYVDNQIKVISFSKDSTAKEAGIKEDDIIVKVNGKDITKKDLKDVVSLIKGKKGTKVSITVMRNEKEKEFSVKRGTINLSSVESKVIEKDGKKVGYIDVSVFASNTYSQFKKELTKLEKKNIDSLIIDVRSNPGGHLTQVSKILSLFVNKKTVIYQVESKGKKEKVYSLNNDIRKYKVGVLINKSSASASEILAGCFKVSYKNGTIFGTTSYGKGSVQKAYSISTGSSIKYTTEKWLLPNGKSINEIGVSPDVEVVLSEDYAKNPSDETDNQLQTALDYLTK